MNYQTTDEIEVRIAELRAEIARLTKEPGAEIGRLHKLLLGPNVKVEAYYWRHYSEYYDECDTWDEAVNYLEYGGDTGDFAAAGIRVNGELFKHYTGWKPV